MREVKSNFDDLPVLQSFDDAWRLCMKSTMSVQGHLFHHFNQKLITTVPVEMAAKIL